MNTCSIKIRIATPADAETLLHIYTPYVENTAITFEYDVPTPEEFAGRIRRVLEKYPYLVAEADGQAAGYAYAGPFVGRAAYGWGAELSIYLDENKKRMGLGRKLYESLEAILAAQGILNLEACIGYPQAEDEHLTLDSVRFHEHMGFRMVGGFSQCGYKFGRWYDMVWMEKIIGPHFREQPPVKAFSEVAKGFFPDGKYFTGSSGVTG